MMETPMQKAKLLVMGVLVWLAAMGIFLWLITEHIDSERRIVEAERQRRAEYCTWVTVWRAGVNAGIPWESRRGHPDHKRVFDKWCAQRDD